MSEPIDLVSAALVACQGEMPSAAFDTRNQFLGNRYASLGAVIATSRPILAKHGLAILQVLSTEQFDLGKKTEVVTGDPKKGTPDRAVIVDSVRTYAVVETTIIHESGQSMSGGILKLPVNQEKGKSMAQVAGSLFTYLKRYAWASSLGIFADEDNDGNEPESPQSSRGVSGHHPEPKNAAQSQPEPQLATLAAPKELPPATPESRMKALNKLNAAPGQANRPLIEHFFLSKHWIAMEDQPESWPLEHVPRSQKQFEALVEEVRLFELRMRAQPEAAE